jgi:flagellar biogenesis protein FliO
MRWVAATIGLFLLSTYPVRLSAQVVPYYGPASPSNEAAPSLSPPKAHSVAGQSEPEKIPGGIQSITTVGGSLAAVLGIFFLIVWALRRASPNGSATLPCEVFEVLGRAALTNRQQVYLLRCGNKLLLVSVTAAGAETLTEIADPAEVDRLAGLCRQTRSNGAAAAFRQAFRRVENRDV